MSRRVYTRCLPLLSYALLSSVPVSGETLQPAPDTPPEARIFYAPHGDPTVGFYAPWSTPQDRSFVKLMRWLLSGNSYDRSAAPVVPRIPNDGGTLSGFEPDTAYTWVGHSTFAIHEGDEVVLTDPHFGPRALIPKRESPPGIPIEAVPPDAFAVISHNHYDHLDAFTVDALPESVQWFVPLGLAEWFRDRGRPNVVELDWWESARRGAYTITCLPSQHWSRRIEHGVDETLWCAWLIDSGRTRTFFAGDTGYFGGFAEFARRFGPIDLALMPIGAYAPRWFMKWQHVNPAEAVQATLDLDAETMLGMHWGTFDLTDEPVDLPPRRLAEVVEERGLDPDRFRSLAIGETLRVRD